MACDCDIVERSPLWSAVPEYRQPTEIQQGENIDCYAKRAGSPSGLKNDIGEQIPNTIRNTSFTSSLNAVVNETFVLNPGPRIATSWQYSIDGQTASLVLPELTWGTNGVVTGTVGAAHVNQAYNVLVIASDGSGAIDSRAFTFFPKIGTKDDTIKFVMPLQGNCRVSCGFGPRNPPALGASSMHNGYDFAMVDHSQGIIVAAADGVVVKAGPATGFGNWIVIEHYDAQERLVCTTVYGHMNDGNIFVNVGDKVAAGQKIALEGNAGIGSGMHLHFEIHKGKWKKPTDPGPYLDGTLSIATDNDPNVIGEDGTPAPLSFETRTITDSGMTTDEAYAGDGCPDELPNNPPPNASPEVTNDQSIGSNRSSCAPASTPDGAAVMAQIDAALNADSSLTADDKLFIKFVAKIESGLDPYAKNPTSSATGLYQFLDALAVKYYDLLGIPPTCQNRCDPFRATQAMILFFKQEIKPYWDNYVASGKTTIAGKPIQPTPWSDQYVAFQSNEFMYGLVHHDGVGNAVKGKDLGGVAYWRSKT